MHVGFINAMHCQGKQLTVSDHFSNHELLLRQSTDIKSIATSHVVIVSQSAIQADRQSRECNIHQIRSACDQRMLVLVIHA